MKGKTRTSRPHTPTHSVVCGVLPLSISAQSQVSYLSVFTSSNLFRRAGGGEQVLNTFTAVQPGGF